MKLLTPKRENATPSPPGGGQGRGRVQYQVRQAPISLIAADESPRSMDASTQFRKQTADFRPRLSTTQFRICAQRLLARPLPNPPPEGEGTGKAQLVGEFAA